MSSKLGPEFESKVKRAAELRNTVKLLEEDLKVLRAELLTELDAAGLEKLDVDGILIAVASGPKRKYLDVEKLLKLEVSPGVIEASYTSKEGKRHLRIGKDDTGIE